MFEAEAGHIQKAFGELALRIEHVGSTAVPGTLAKPVIDIQVSVRSLVSLAVYLPALCSLGYVYVPLGEFDSVYPFFQKPADWPSSHHVHLCVAGGELEPKHLAFRDHLRSHPNVAEEYGSLKQSLAAQHHGTTLESRERYSLRKSAFVMSVLEQAMRATNPEAQRGA
jgi:GrpB-like predicted nucleotidyltransferase (UPF0157 family)